MKLTMAFAAALLLSACATDSAALNDPEFVAGYDAGCAMAHSPRDVRAAMTKGRPDLFRRGFASGLSACGDHRDVVR
jgi:Skp family chaperone for outer membrane proteins